MERKLCPICKKNPQAINYYRGDKVYFRSACTPCINQKRKPIIQVPGWVKSGYKKHEKCDRCSFKFKLNDQSKVFYVDGNTNNNHWANLRTICLNCTSEVAKTSWRPSPIQPDF